MAEHFYGRNHVVHTSNGGAILLLEELTRISYRLDETESVVVIRKFLKNRLDNYPDGSRSFSLDLNKSYPKYPNELRSDENLGVFFILIEKFAKELQKSKPHLNVDNTWDRDCRLLWLSKTVQLHEMVRDVLNQKSIKSCPLDFNISKTDQDLLDYNTYSTYYAQLCKIQKKNEGLLNNCMLYKQLGYLDKMIALSNKEWVAPKSVLIYHLHDRVTLLERLKETGKAILDLENIIRLLDHNNDEERKEAEELVADIRLLKSRK